MSEHERSITLLRKGYRLGEQYAEHNNAICVAVSSMQMLQEREKGCEMCATLPSGGCKVRLLDPEATFCSRCGRQLKSGNLS